MKTLRINKEDHYCERSNFWLDQWHDGFLPAAELMLAEAVGLVNTLDNWTVVDSIILSTKTPEKKRIFGKGNFQSLTGIVGVIHWVSVRNWSVWESFCCSSIRENSPNARNHSCVCQRWAPVSFVRGRFLCHVPSGCIQKAFLHQLSLLPVQKELKEAWGVNVFDRYSVVLHIFRCNAQTKEAKLQISLAEIPLLR